MRKLIVLPLLIGGILLAATACGTKDDMGDSEMKKETEDKKVAKSIEFDKKDYEQIITANNELGFKLLGEVEADENNNTFISPTSLYMALSMVYNGADGVTKDEIAKALQIEGIDADELNKASASMMSVLDKKTDEIQLDVANSIWLNEKYHFQKEFAENNKGYFNAEIEEIDVASSESPKRINDWVKKATNEKIEEIVDSPLDSNLISVLINAIYFKGDWTYQFEEDETENRPFYTEDGGTKDVPLMLLNKELAYMENEDFQAVVLPYGDGEMSMKVFLPKESSSLEEFKKTITSENWALWDSAFTVNEGTVRLPKFELEYEVSLNEALKSLGMESAFDDGADFTNMIEEETPVWISNVKQKTFINVNEEGTEAAAVTSTEMKTTSMPVDQPFEIEVNRPFFFTITDDETDAILFMGSVANPEQAK